MECEIELLELNRYIAFERSLRVADRFVDSIVDYCESLAVFPMRGRARSDLYPGLRIVGFRRRVSIAFVVDDSTVTIHGVFYAGREYERRWKYSVE